jgi:hypothetical protein
MSTQLEETAILGLRAQILGKHTTPSEVDNVETLLLDNVLFLQYSPEDILLTTIYKSQGWIAVVFGKASGRPICSTKGGDDTVLDALRNLLKHISERIDLSTFADCLDDVEEHETVTSAGIEYIVSCT